VELEYLSKWRAPTNKQKVDELITLLHKYKVDNVVKLGLGTNRYGFKLDGFVVKFALDQDGKIDNFKEFKMAKILYPYVIKVYEVTESGTLAVAEYIQPFDTYAEMCQHRESIKRILVDISSRYLIGDVGISSDNYGNWGLRIGSNTPVCLDFAYVYEVSSSLFACNHCKPNVTLIPTDEFSNLICPKCKVIHSFSSIRARIGNDLHRHEIGDLSDEGYKISSSNVLTELDVEKSFYVRKQVEKLAPVEEVNKPEKFKFTLTEPIDY
jgi:hypothetical protein